MDAEKVQNFSTVPLLGDTEILSHVHFQDDMKVGLSVSTATIKYEVNKK